MTSDVAEARPLVAGSGEGQRLKERDAGRCHHLVRGDPSAAFGDDLEPPIRLCHVDGQILARTDALLAEKPRSAKPSTSACPRRLSLFNCQWRRGPLTGRDPCAARE